MLYKFTRQELKAKKASEFKERDVIKTGVYFIHIHYKSKDGKHKFCLTKGKILNLVDARPGQIGHIILMIF